MVMVVLHRLTTAQQLPQCAGTHIATTELMMLVDKQQVHVASQVLHDYALGRSMSVTRNVPGSDNDGIYSIDYLRTNQLLDYSRLLVSTSLTRSLQMLRC